MTGTNDKVRSLFLSALMVMSVVAMGTAFTAGAVADSGNDTIELVTGSSDTAIDVSNADDDDKLTQTVAFNAYTDDENAEEVTVDMSDAEDSGLSLSSAEIDDSDATVVDSSDDEVEIELDSGFSGDELGLDLTWDVSDAESDASLDHSFESTGTEDGNPYVDDFSYRVLGDDSVSITTDDGGNEVSIFRGEEVGFDEFGNDVTITIYEEDDDNSGERSTTVRPLATGSLADSINWDTSSLDAGETYIIGVSGTETDVSDITLRVNDLGLSAEPESASITTEDQIEVTADSNDADSPFTARLLDSDGEAVQHDDSDVTTIGDFDGTGSADFSFPAAEDRDYGTGNYTVEVEHNNTGITTETDSIEISEAGDGDVSFAGDGVVSEEAGDIANVTVEMTNTDEATVTIGTEDQGYYLVTQVTDESGDGQVSLEFNSYTAGVVTPSNVVEKANDDDEMDIIAQGGDFTEAATDDDGYYSNEDDFTDGQGNAVGDETLDPTEYEMNATIGHVEMGTDAYTDSDALGTLSLQPRSTDSMQSWVTPKGTDIADLEVDDVYDEIGSSITESGEVAYDDEDNGDGDTVILQLEAGGIEGAVDYTEDGLVGLATAEYADDEAIDLTIEQTNEEANRSPKEIGLDDDAISVIEDPENDSYFVAVETSNLDQPARDLAEGDNFEATFTIEQDNVLNGLDDDESEEVSSEFTLVEPSTDLVTNTEDDLILIESASSQTVSGQTNYAPGTDLTVRVQSSDSASPFQVRPEATVQTDGTFTTEGADFSDVSPGTNLTLQTRRGGSPVGDEYDGRIGEVPTASVSISNQTTDGSTVTVDSVTTENGGFVAIHLNNASGEVIGNSEYLDSGTQQDVEISLDSALDENATVVAMPHQDTNDNEEYDFGDGDGADGPYTENGSAVTDSATVTIQTTEETDTPTPEPETDTPTPEPETDTPTPDEGDDTPTDDGGDETTTGDGAGFGAVVALVGLLAAALLATRRNN